MSNMAPTQLSDTNQTPANITATTASAEDYPLMPASHLSPADLPYSLLVRAFRRHWRLMLIIFVLTGAVGLLLSRVFVHPVYQAVAQLRFDPRPGVDGILSASDGRAGYSGYLNTELSQIHRREILEAVVSDLRLGGSSFVDELQARTYVVGQANGQMVSVVVCGSSAQDLAKTANAIVKAYLAHDVIPQIEKHQRETQGPREEIASLRNSRKDLLEQLAGRDSENYIRALYHRRQSYIQPLSEARRDINDAEKDYEQASARLATLTAAAADNEKVKALLAELTKNDPLLEMYRSIYQTMIASSDQKKLFGPSSEPLISGSSSAGKKTVPGENDRKIAIIEQIRVGMTQRLTELKNQSLEEAKELRRVEIAALQAVVDSKERSYLKKDQRLHEFLAQDTTAAEEIQQVRHLSGQLDTLDKAIKDHAKRLRDLAVELLPPAKPALAQPASGAVKVSDLRWFFFPGSILLAGLLAIACGSLVEHFDSRLSHAGDIVRRVGIPVLASLPSSDDAQSDDIWLPQEISMADYISDQYRNIRTAVLFGQGTPPRTIVVTAPTAAETKTTLSVNLAISIARSGRTVLLVDADLDSPALADVFDVAASPGWSDVLRNPISLPQAICRTRIERLSIMPAGSELNHSAELLSSPSCRDLIDSLAKQFEHVIIDAPSLLDCHEGRIIGALADGVICSFSSQSTRSGQARQATAILEELGASVIGSVLNT